MGRVLIIIGIVFVVLGLILTFGVKIPYLGKLPGDIFIRKGNFTFYFPVATCVLISVVLTVLFFIFGKK